MVWQDVEQKVSRFAVLKHVRDSDVHWDLLLQMPDRELLATWQIRLDPARWGGESEPVAAVQLPDHRIIYLDYQGELSANRGWVTHVDGGKMELLCFDEQRIHFLLHGQILHGAFTITRTAAGIEGQLSDWRLKAEPE